ncbi:MAG: tetratricopeptide repeat protein [Bryobacterales bacterium]|nr:tetratricopeptide repeat protein [Bryobacterales bacterium]
MTVLWLWLLFFQAADEQARQARALLEARRYAEAAAAYESLAAQMPGTAGLWLNVGLARFQGGEYGRAAEALERAVKLQPSLAPAQLMLGMTRLKRSEPARAIAPLETAVRLDAKNELARAELASAYLEAGQYARAEAAYAKLPGDKAALGRGYALVEMAAQATRELERVAPESSWMLALRCRALLAQDRREEAMEQARRAAAKKPVAPGVAELLEGKPEPAPPAPWARLLADARPLAASLYWRALAATALATETLSQLAGKPEGLELQAESLRAQGKYRESAGVWEQAMAAAPRDARLAKRRAQALWQAGDWEAVGQALAGLPEDGDVLFLRGDLAQRAGEAAAARAAWEKGAAIAPGLVAMRAALGKLLLENGEAAVAIPHLEAAREMEPAVWFQLSRAYAAAGRRADAARAAREFQARQAAGAGAR